MTFRAALVTGSVIAVAVVGCASAPARQPSPSAAALAYMRAHPATPVAGMTAGVVLTATYTGFYGAAAVQAACPASLTASIRGAVGTGPQCAAWSATALVPSGRVVAFSCGDVATRIPCPMMLPASGAGYSPGPGDYARWRSDGRVASPADAAVITQFAVSSVTAVAPGVNAGWVTAPATGGA
jgi:hypothetical protein